MTDKRYTPEGLPIVTPEVVRAYGIEAVRGFSGGEERLLEGIEITISRRAHNPFLFQYLDKLSRSPLSLLVADVICKGNFNVRDLSRILRVSYTSGVTATYDLLARQGETYLLEDSAKKPER